MRLYVLVAILLCPQVALADNLPNLVCQEIVTETILPSTWSMMGDSKVKSLFKFVDGNLFVSSAVQDEELIGKITRVRGMKYQSGQKTIVFSNSVYKEATVVHHDKNFIQISKLQCTKI